MSFIGNAGFYGSQQIQNLRNQVPTDMNNIANILTNVNYILIIKIA